MRATLAAVATAISLLVMTAPAGAATITFSGTLNVNSVGTTDTHAVSAGATVSYSCTPSGQFDYCGSYYAYVTVVTAGQPCTTSGLRWVGTTTGAASQTYAPTWSEYGAGPKQLTACLYGWSS